ncbi:MAG: universal stress protein [Candidatus Nanohalobium sp.]
MYSKILVPTDGSSEAEQAVDYALDLAERYDAEVHVVYVVDDSVTPEKELMDSIRGEFRRRGEEATERILEKARLKNLETVREIAEGVPSEQIVDYIDENSIDLTVMSTHGRTGLKRVLMGSTTERVLRESSSPVMTIGPGKE